MVEAMDTEMGRLLSNVDLATTTVIFMGDNGTLSGVIQPPFPSDHSKGSVYEGGVRVPLLIYGAAVSNELAGTTYDEPLHSVDLYATILDLFGEDAETLMPDELVLDSRSFASVLTGAPYTRLPADIMIQTETGDPGRSITEGDYKLIHFDSGTQEFYNVSSDLPEATNLLSGTLSAPDQLIFDHLETRLATYYNEPVIYQAEFDANDHFNVEVGWFDQDGLTLWRTEDLTSNSWAAVSAQEMENPGGSTLILRDPAPPSPNAYYRVTVP